ncbi:unnamed protein product [Caenorhabditis nigoni]
MKLFILLLPLVVLTTISMQHPIHEKIRNCVLNYLDPACLPKNFHGNQNAKEQGEQNLVQTPSRHFANNCPEDLPSDFFEDCDNGDSVPADFNDVGVGSKTFTVYFP